MRSKATGGIRRLLGPMLATLALAAVAYPAAATARTVYDYEYSGTYIDGSSVGKTFNMLLGGVTYDPVDKVLLIANGNLTEPGWVTKLTRNGTPVNFFGVGSPFLVPTGVGIGFQNAQIAVDRTGGPGDGRIYVSSRTSLTNAAHGFTPDGLPLPGFNFSSTDLCGIAVNSSDEFSDLILAGRNGMYRFEPDGTETRWDFGSSPGFQPGINRRWAERGRTCYPVIDSQNNLYGIKDMSGSLSSNGYALKTNLLAKEIYEVNQFTNNVGIAVDLATDDVFVLRGAGGVDATFETYDREGRPLGAGFGAPDVETGHPGLIAGPGTGITVDPETHDVWVANRREYADGVRRVEKFIRTNPQVVPDTTAVAPGYISADGSSIELRGVLNADGQGTTECHFEYGPTQALGTSVPCVQGDVFTGADDHQVSAVISVPKGTRYWYRLASKNENGKLARSNQQAFFPQGRPVLASIAVDRVNTDGARFRAEFEPNGGNASYHFEYGVPGSLDSSTPESGTFGFKTENGVFTGQDFYDPGNKAAAEIIDDLEAGTEYEMRVVLTNEAGSVASEPVRFTTYVPDPGTDSCPNAQARQQTESSLLADCRAYELVSAGNAGGFDVVSSVVPGQEPLTAAPRATDRLLYSMHFGVIPGVAGSPTNKGLDPYVAERGPDGWTTRYAGLPSDGMATPSSFGSPLIGTDSALRTFAFGGAGICSPCFPDGSTNVPLRVDDSPAVVKGMAGSQNPAADPEGEVRVPISRDGSHFFFGSSQKFAAAGNSGSLSIYSRELATETTTVVSTRPNGTTISGPVAQLDASDDGRRVLIGVPVGTDPGGNATYDLYMHVGTSPQTVAVAETPNGVVFNGMSGDGSKVFFTTDDPLDGDTDTGADLFRADVGATAATISRISVGSGGAGNTDACAPSGNWNVAAGGSNCGTVAFAGGAGIARGSGAAYFLSPELLGGPGQGEAGEPNLFVAFPGGSPTFVATLEADNRAIERALTEAAVHSFGDFQVSPSGEYAAFSTTERLEPGYNNLGFEEIYRYRASDSALDCVSCAPTGAVPRSDTALTESGLNLTDDGPVFFTTLESFTLRDTNERRDAYQWDEGAVQLISAGIGQDDSSLATVSADGRNAFFFTRDTLSPTDTNGATVKVYVARAGGGISFDPSRFPCAAADECRGAASVQPPPPSISSVTGSGLPSAVLQQAPKAKQPPGCRKGFVKWRGKCVNRKTVKKRKAAQRKRAKRKQKEKQRQKNNNRKRAVMQRSQG